MKRHYTKCIHLYILMFVSTYTAAMYKLCKLILDCSLGVESGIMANGICSYDFGIIYVDGNLTLVINLPAALIRNSV